MFGFDLVIYAVHAAFWSAFAIAHRILGARNSRDSGQTGPVARVSQKGKTAPFSRALLALHMIAFFTMYFGIAQAVLPGHVPAWFSGQRMAGFITIAAGAALMVWALVYFRSWRFRAKLEEGHQLATGGPFRILRHPIYMGLNLLALGSALWVPTAIVWSALVLMVVGSDLRARAEETILRQAFGSSYRDYCDRTSRFLPGIY
jgi:protein-S-isoprenylcysteine O-methyltransferase Ste14